MKHHIVTNQNCLHPFTGKKWKFLEQVFKGKMTKFFFVQYSSETKAALLDHTVAVKAVMAKLYSEPSQIFKRYIFPNIVNS